VASYGFEFAAIGTMIAALIVTGCGSGGGHDNKGVGGAAGPDAVDAAIAETGTEGGAMDLPTDVVTYFSVGVEVTGPTGRDKNKLAQVISAEVTASGAISGESIFLLDNFPRAPTYDYGSLLPDGQLLLARFQYGTTKESGHLEFKIDLHNGTNGPDGVIGSGSGGGDIKPGATIDVIVVVTPSAFAD